MRDTMVDLLLLGVGLSVTLADTFGDDAGITLGVASVLAVLTLHTGRVLEEVAAQRTSHDVVELVLDELVAVHLVDLLLALTDSALSAKTEVYLPAVLVRLHEAQLQVDLTRGFQIEPPRDGTSVHLDLWPGSAKIPTGSGGPWRATLTAERALRWAHRKLRWRRGARGALHPIGRHPSRTVHLGFDPLSAHLLHDVGYPNPEQTDGHGMLARLVVHCELDLVGLVHFKRVILGFPSVVAGGAGPRHDSVFHLDGDERLRAARESSRRGMVHILDSDDPDAERATQWLSEIRHTNRIIYKAC